MSGQGDPGTKPLSSAGHSGSRDEAALDVDNVSLPADVPLPQNPNTVFLGGLFALGCVALLYLAADVTLPVVMAIVLKLLLQPLVRLLERARLPRTLCAMIAVVLVLAVFGATISLLAGPAADWAAMLPRAIPKLRESITILRHPIDALQRIMNQIAYMAGSRGSYGAGPAVTPYAVIGAALSASASVTTSLLTTLLVLFYLLVSGETFLRRLMELLPRSQDKRNVLELSTRIERHVAAYLLAVGLINAVVGFATGCAMWLTGVADPLLWGAAAFVLNFVPILGPMVGIVLFLMASVLSFGVVWYTLLPVGLYLCIHIVEGEIATPMLLARRFTINPVAVVLSLIFWYWMWGVAGAVLSFPMLAAAKIACDDIRPLRAFGHLLEG